MNSLASYVMPRDLKVRFDEKWAEFQKLYPELFIDEGRIPVSPKDKERFRECVTERRFARMLLLKHRDELWAEFIGRPVLAVPSSRDSYREASCVRCRDVGWIQKYRTNVEGTRFYSDPIPCPDCSPDEEARQKRLMGYSGIPDTQSMQTFESFKRVKGSETALKSVKDLVAGAQYFMVLLAGTYGNGKTHLAIAATRQAIKQGMKAKFVYIPSLFSEIKLAMDSGSGAQEIINKVKDVTFLALDDMGAEQSTEWKASIIEEIINHRYQNCLYTIVTTNKDIKTLAGPLLSRFKDSTMCRIVINDAPDYRPKKSVAPGTTD